MKKLLLVLALSLLPSLAFAQCNGVFPNNTACGNVTGSSNTPRPIPLSSFPTATPGGTNGQIQYNNSGAFGGFTAGQDCTITPSTGAVNCTKLQNVPVTTTGASANDVLYNNGSGWLHNTVTSVLNAACGLSPSSCGTIFGYLNASWYMAGTTCDGTTDQYANIQAFLTQLSVNGVNGTGPITGNLAPGNCFVSAGTPTFTMNSSTLVQQYHIIGYGTTITPDPTKSMNALTIARGTLATYPDEQSGVTVEGLTTNLRNNNHANWGIEFTNPHTTILRTQCYAGDDGTTHNQVNLACIYGHQSVATDPTTGPFWSRIIGNVIKGTGTSTSALPNCMRFDGQVNALYVAQNTCNEALVGMLVANACATTNANCAAQANGVVVENNAWESLSEGINFITTVPSLTALARWNIHDNRVENVTVQFIDLSHITQASTFPVAIGNDMLIGTTTYVFNPNSIAFNKLSATSVSTTLSTWP
jgi:hypothetical protein